jgi:hypothetical protein
MFFRQPFGQKELLVVHEVFKQHIFIRTSWTTYFLDIQTESNCCLNICILFFLTCSLYILTRQNALRTMIKLTMTLKMMISLTFPLWHIRILLLLLFKKHKKAAKKTVKKSKRYDLDNMDAIEESADSSSQAQNESQPEILVNSQQENELDIDNSQEYMFRHQDPTFDFALIEATANTEAYWIASSRC